jgi:hypothetical protein
MPKPDVDWDQVAAALATKVGAIAGINSSTSLVPDGSPILPAAIVLPPVLSMIETASTEGYTARFPIWINFARPGDTATALAFLYPFIKALFTAFRTGRELGGQVDTSRLISSEPVDGREYGGNYLSIRAEAEVLVQVVVAGMRTA